MKFKLAHLIYFTLLSSNIFTQNIYEGYFPLGVAQPDLGPCIALNTLLDPNQNLIHIYKTAEGFKVTISDSNYNIIREKHYKPTTIKIIDLFMVSFNSNHDIIAVGTAEGNKILIIKLSTSGDLIWSKTYSNNLTFAFNAMALNAANEIIIGCLANHRTVGQSYFTFLVNNNGNIINSQRITLNYTSFYSMYNATSTADGSFILAGSGPNVGQKYSIWLLKINRLGLVEWSKVHIPINTPTQSYGAFGVSIQAIDNDKYLVMGRYGDDNRGSNPQPNEMNGLMVEINSSGNVLRSNKLRLNNSIYSNPVDVVYDNGNYYLVGAESYTHVGEGFFLTKYNTQSNSASVKYFSGNMRYTRIEKYNSKLLLTGFTTINNKNYQYYNLMDTQNFDICEGANITANFIPIQLQENNHSYSLESNLLQSDEIFEPIQSSCLYTNVTLCKTENNKSYYKVEYKTSYNIDTTIHICKNSTIAFNGKIYGSTGIFYDTISHQYDCDTIFKIEINARSSDSTNLQYSICQGDTIIIHGKAIHQEGEYSINLVNASGCDSILLIVIHLTNLIKINKNYSICHGDSIKINGIYYKNSISFQDTIYGLNQCDSIIHINIVQAEESNSFIELNICDHDSILIDQKYYSSEGIHTLNYTNQSGCDSIVKVQIHKLSISTNVIDTFVCNEEFIKIGDVIILQPGYYFIDLKNYLNCDSLIEARVNSKDCYQIYIPNAFSPNQDMVNDEFKIYHNGVSNLDIEIYDRWGGLVFKSNSISFTWDGKFKGDDCMIAVYAYLIRGKYTNAKDFLFKGNITLIR